MKVVTLYRYNDIHTHTASHIDDVLSVLNVYQTFDSIKNGGVYSVGLHPWYLQNADVDFDSMTAIASKSNVLAIGECGLDKVCATDWALQLSYFQKQVRLANALSKPLIIHCVRAFEEVIEVLDAEKVHVPVVFHGYNKNNILARRLLHKGYYLSIGAAILNGNSTIQQVVKEVPADRFFAETDNSGKSIIDIYHCLAEIRKTEVDTIILQLQDNFKSVFVQ
jgi:TatD DNase family protein